jgi:release factor glutamine methyltransferase
MLLRDLIDHAAAAFESAGIHSAKVDAELLVGHVLGLSRGGVQAAAMAGRQLTDTEAEEITNVFGRRRARQPLQHITGVAYFRNLELKVGSGVFIPRPETEFVAQLAIDAMPETENSIAVDLGTGSGAIALSIATEVPTSQVFAVEKSEQAYAYTAANFAKYVDSGAKLVLGDLADAFVELENQVAVVVSNPPYIPAAAIPRDVEVHLHDPDLALYGGEDGLDVIRLVSASATRLLMPGGALIIEHADSQSEQVVQLLLAEGWREVRAHQDLTARYRAVTAIK